MCQTIFSLPYSAVVPGPDRTNVDCAVCFGPIENRILLQPCRHAQFCENCIKRVDADAEARAAEPKCPLCNVAFTDYFRIFV